MGYDLLIFRNVFVNIKDVESSTTLIGNDKNPIIKEHVDSLRGWDVSEVVNNYIENNTQEISIEDLISIYEDCGIEPYEKLKNQLEIDSENEGAFGVYYEVSQSY
jgi:hypothetical protein